jgi:hypothetical protein
VLGSSRRHLAVLGAVAAGAVILAHPSSAVARTASVSGPTLSYLAGSGEANTVAISLASGMYAIADTTAAVTA